MFIIEFLIIKYLFCKKTSNEFTFLIKAMFKIKYKSPVKINSWFYEWHVWVILWIDDRNISKKPDGEVWFIEKWSLDSEVVRYYIIKLNDNHTTSEPESSITVTGEPNPKWMKSALNDNFDEDEIL